MKSAVSIVLGALLAGMATGGHAQQVDARTGPPVRAELAAPPELSRASIPERAVVLRADNQAQLLRALPAQRRLDQRQLRAQPVIQLRQGEANLRPVLDNPVSPINIATRLRDRPQLARVKADTIELAEIPQGIVVRQFVAYQIALGACTSAASRRSLEAQGVECFQPAAPEVRTRELADPQSARFIADPGQRAQAAARIGQEIAAQQAEIDADLAQFRAQLANPRQRAEMEAKVGAAEVARLAGLDHRALEAELLNNADIEIEEVMFVPNVEPERFQFQSRQDFGTVGRAATIAELDRVARDEEGDETTPAPAARGPTDLRGPARRPQGMTDLAAAPQLDVSEDIGIETHAYLTGFTLGRQNEWSRRVSITVYWCLVGCKRTYYVEPYAGFSYGFGLRFPLRVAGTYRYRHQNGQERAWIVPTFSTFDGNAAEYGAMGVPSSKRFNGQELVAEAQAYAGLLFKLPAGRTGDIGFSVGVDVTDRLPQPYRNGQFKPPSPGQNTPPIVRTITEVDLIGGRANFHVVGARVHPAVKFELTSNGIRFRLRDHVADTSTWMDASGEAYPLAVNKHRFSRFTISDPVYNLAFLMTPGIEGRVFVDIAVWSQTWKWPVWFPQLAVQLPPGGADFACHAQTRCSHLHQMRAAHWNRARDTTTTRPGPRPDPPVKTSRPARAPVEEVKPSL